MSSRKAIVIGAGIAGLSAAIRLAIKGFEVKIFESNAYAGGKLSEIQHQGYRFDAGPSLFTMPQYVDELFHLAGKNPRAYFQYERLQTVCHYFYPSGKFVKAYADKDAFVQELSAKFGVNPAHIYRFLANSANIYNITQDVFLANSLHLLKNYLKFSTLKSALQFGKIDAFRTQHQANVSYFQQPELVQLFDRYATYNGSNPYQAPATLNVIPHFEYGFGAYIPKGGMYQITKSLLQLAIELGVEINYHSPVSQIVLEGKKAIAVQVNGAEYPAEIIVSNVDIYFTYKHLLDKSMPIPQAVQQQERSSSALIFYWGIKKSFAKLDLHNIFFSKDYRAEFEAIFNQKTICNDPTVYLNITSKKVDGDAPEGCENWFTMINVPNDAWQNWEELITQARQNILQKISATLGEDVSQLIECEDILHPKLIQSRTGSYLGSLYGSSSNSKFAAFLRHPNFSFKIKNLYFCGGSVHPGGGIPLALLSAKIATDFINK